jgi:hypothetical protein
VLKALKGKGPWRASSQASDWIGKVIAEAAGLDLKEPQDRKAVVGQIAEWVGDNVLTEFTGTDDKANPRPMIGWPGADFSDHTEEEFDFG